MVQYGLLHGKLQVIIFSVSSERVQRVVDKYTLYRSVSSNDFGTPVVVDFSAILR